MGDQYVLVLSLDFFGFFWDFRRWVHTLSIIVTMFLTVLYRTLIMLSNNFFPCLVIEFSEEIRFSMSLRILVLSLVIVATLIGTLFPG